MKVGEFYRTDVHAEQNKRYHKNKKLQRLSHPCSFKKYSILHCMKILQGNIHNRR